MKRGKTLTVIMLAIFTGLALYLCPCSFAEPVSGLQITKAPMHDCCEGMSECPLKNQNTPGLKNFLDAFSHDSRSNQAFDFDLKQLHESQQLFFSVPDHLQLSFDFIRHWQEQNFKVAPPEYFLRFESLLI